MVLRSPIPRSSRRSVRPGSMRDAISTKSARLVPIRFPPATTCWCGNGCGRRSNSTASSAAMAGRARKPSSRAQRRRRSPAGSSPGRIRRRSPRRSAGTAKSTCLRATQSRSRGTVPERRPSRSTRQLPALQHVEAILEELYGKRPLRVAMGATVPIGTVFRREARRAVHLLQLRHVGRRLPRAERVLPPGEIPRRARRLGSALPEARIGEQGGGHSAIANGPLPGRTIALHLLSIGLKPLGNAGSHAARVRARRDRPGARSAGSAFRPCPISARIEAVRRAFRRSRPADP